MRYRLRQVKDALWGALSQSDWALINSSLNQKELLLFKRLAKADQYHSMQVAKSGLDLNKELKLNVDENLILKGALLHDIGKLDFRLALIDRVLPVILTKMSAKLSRWLGRNYSTRPLVRGFYVYWNHQHRGSEIAAKAGIDPLIIDLIQRHQEHIATEDSKLLWLIKKADSLN